MTIQDSHLPPNSPRLLPPQDFPERPTLVLDLDHTLICTTHYQPPARYDFVINYETDGYLNTSYVLKRPGLDEFLLRAADMYEVVIFTAGIREYASVVVDEIDPKGLISHRLYRDSCKVLDGKFVKDLDAIGRELKTVILVEDNSDPKGLISHRLYRDSCKVLDGKFVKDLDAIGRELKTVILVEDNSDPKGLISHRLYRDSCKVLDGKFVKDLDAIGRELKTVILVEDNRDACILNLENTILLPPFSDDLEDVELDMLGYFLEFVLIFFEDLRDGVNQYNNAGLGDDFPLENCRTMIYS